VSLDSVIKLANLISYNAKRNLTAQGYIKVTSIQTTEDITDINGFNLSNVPVLWNDPANSNWLNQYNTIVNATLINSQRVGRPGNSAQLLGVKTDEYTMNIPGGNLPVVPFSAVVNNQTMNFELVSVTSLDQDYVYEIPPAPTGKMNMLYRNDKLGYGSPNTGFFFYFKQGRLQSYDFNLQQQISNQVVDISDIQGVNNTDTWLFQLSTDNTSVVTRTLWKEVENVYADAYLQTETSGKKIFSVVSRYNDQVSYSFGDGVFSEIPVGTFRSYVRAGNALTYTIDPTEMQGLSVTINYISRAGRTEALTLGLELQLPVSNAQARETLANIKQRAPARYYTQNRMVNGEDYNNFPYTLYNSIIKSKAINRSSIGVSKNLDLLDPTGKYSSTNSFANDGAIYQNSDNGNLGLTITSTGDIITFLTTTLAAELADNRAKQYYLQNFTRYNVNSSTGDGTVYWKESTVDANSVTGYFYNISGSDEIPIPIGTYSTYSMKYATKGAMIKLTAPAGYYFDANNRLVAGIPSASNPTYIWTTVLNVIGDGYNNGTGQFSNGTGPVTLNAFIPEGVIVTQIIPAFDNSLPALVIQECITRMELNQDFSLVFNNSLLVSQDRWSVDSYDATNWFVNFNSLGYVKVLATNTQYNSNYPLSKPVQVSILGQTVESDGYINDFEVEVASIDVNDRTIINDPDFFTTVTGYQPNTSNIGIYVFFELVEDAISLSRYQIIPSTSVNYAYATKNQIEVVKYEYPEGQLFYAYSENKFYTTIQDETINTPYYVLTEQPQYTIQYGRQGLQFQYRHNSNNTTRIDPATTNIIDLYLVTQAYYTQYQNWIQDTTGTIAEPNKPTINELNQSYGTLQDYKMLSDSLIPNSVTFKPLFGAKAAPALRATVKVVKSTNTNASNSEIRSAVLSSMNSYFNINNWNFGDTFYFSELSAYLHDQLGELISSVVLVPNNPTQSFGDLYEIKCAPYEIFQNAATASDIQVIAALTPAELQIR